jgi:dihydroflavonol-4-reductase
VRARLRRGLPTRGLVRSGRPTTSLHGLGVELYEGDVLAPETLEAAMRGVEVVFHTATYFAYGRPADGALEALAVDGAANVLRAAAQAGVRRVVLTSSSVVFGYGDTPVVLDETAEPDETTEGAYVTSKIRQDRAAGALAAQLGLEIVFACPTLVIGPHPLTLGPSNGIITGYLADPMRLTFGGGCNLVGADDVGEGHQRLAERGADGEHYILGGENLTWPETHTLIAELAGVARPSLKLDPAGAYAAAVAAEFHAKLTGKAPITTREQARMAGRYYWYSPAKAERLGFAPRPIRPVLAATIADLAAGPNVSRETRASMRLSPEVWAARSRALEPHA